MTERKVRYRGRKVHPKPEKRKIVFYPETQKSKKPIWDILFFLFLILLVVGVIYFGIKGLIGVWKW